MTKDQIIKSIEDYCEVHSLALSTFGRLSVNDGKLYSRLKSGGSITLETASIISEFISSKETA